MSTYTFNDTLTTAMDNARFLLGDTNAFQQVVNGAPQFDDSMPPNPILVMLLSDETIMAMITNYTFNMAVGKLARGLASQYSQEPDRYEDEGGVRVWWQSRIKTWLLLASQYDPTPSASEALGTGGFWTADRMHKPHEHVECDPLTGRRRMRTPGREMGLM